MTSKSNARVNRSGSCDQVSNRARAVLATALVVAATAMACGPSPELIARAGVDPVGRYEFTIVDEGERIPGGMEITGTPGDYTGRVFAEGRPDGTISTVTTGGNQVTVTADFPGMILLARIEFDGDAFAGDWSMRGEGGAVEGRRIIE